MSDIYEDEAVFLATGTPEEKAAALEEVEAAFQEAKEDYRDNSSESNRLAFHSARDKLQRWRKATRTGTMGIMADGVK